MAYNTQVPSFESLPPGSVLPAMLETERGVIQALFTANNSALSPDERNAAKIWVLDNIEKANQETNRYATRSVVQLSERLNEAENPALKSCFLKLAQRVQELIGDDQRVSLEAPEEIEQFWANEAQSDRINGLALRIALVSVYQLVESVTAPRDSYADVSLDTATELLAAQLRKPATNKPDRRDVLNSLSGIVAKWLELTQVLAVKNRLLKLQNSMVTVTFDEKAGSLERFNSFLQSYMQQVTRLTAVFTLHSNSIINALLSEADAAGVDDYDEERA